MCPLTLALRPREHRDCMAMTPGLRRFVLTAHIASSVGWLGAVAAFLALSVAALAGRDAELVGGCYLAMQIMSLFTVVPLSFAAVATGLVQALGTPWGLLRRYWIVVKFSIAALATVALLMHQFTAVARAAELALTLDAETLSAEGVGRVGIQLVGASSIALLLLVTTTTLGVYKPWGLTRHGRRKQPDRRGAAEDATPKGLQPSLRIFLVVIGLVAALYIALHFLGLGLGSHGP